MKDYETIRLAFRDSIVQLELNRPEVRNAFDERMIAEIYDAVKTINAREDVRALVVSGAGSAFSAGADIGWMGRMGRADYEANLQDALGLAHMLDELSRCEKPTVARVNGPAIGGGTGLVAACDITVGARSAFFSFSEVKIGLVPACIAPYVIRRVGQGRAGELFISGRRVGAEEAQQLGLLNFVCDDEKLEDTVKGILKQLISSGPNAMKMAKELVREAPAMNRADVIDYTARLIAELRTSSEGREGTAAFLEKRKPEWLNH